MIQPLRRVFIAALATAILFAAVPAARCAIPAQINFQGKLLDKSNNPRNGSYNFTFKIYDALTAGNLLWSETQSGLSVSNGVFTAQLGAVTPIPASAFGGASAFLEITVGAEVGSPRQALVASPYAFKAASVDSPLPAGDTQYVQVASSLQAGATFYVSSATIGGTFTATGTVTLGGAAGVNDVSVASSLNVSGNLSVTGAGPQVLSGNVQVKGNGLLDSAGTQRITLGATNAVNGNLSAFAGAQLVISTNIAIVGANNNSDRYIGFPFTAGTAVAARNIVVFTGPNQVGTSAFQGDSRAIGVAVTGAALGQTVWVATYGVVTGVVSDGLNNIVTGDAICNSKTAGQATDGGAQNSPVTGGTGGCPGGTSYLGSAMTGAPATAGSTFTLFVHMFLF